MPQLKQTNRIRIHCCFGALALVWAVAGCTTVTGDDPPETCLDVEASANLNQFEGQPHVVVLYFFALQNKTGFLSVDPRRLVEGEKPPGMIGDRWEATVLPGQRVELKEQLPRDTSFVGVVADFYREPSRSVVEPSCGMFGGSKVVLSATDMQVTN